MADNYIFKEASTTDEKVRRAVEVGTDGNGRPILVNKIVAESAYDEDTQHSSGDKGLGVLAVRNDTLASLVDTDGDYAPLQVGAQGALYSHALHEDGSGNLKPPRINNNRDVSIVPLQPSQDQVGTQPTSTSWSDASGTATTSSTQIFASNNSRAGVKIQNLGSNPIYINIGSAATTGSGSFKLPPDATFDPQPPPEGAINMISANGGEPFTAKEVT